MNEKSQKHYDSFLSGELVDLVIPNRHAIYEDGWYQWFNEQRVTCNMAHGLYPNTPQKQEEFLESLQTSQTRLALLIKPKAHPHVIGVASLSMIDPILRQADFAMVIGRKSGEFKAALYGMEAKCLLTEHAFETLGLERINSSQSMVLKDWQRFQILFGYKLEGIKRKAFRKGYKVYDLTISGCLLQDYLALKEMRGGKLWPGSKKMMELIRVLPAESLEEKLNPLLSETVESHYSSIRMA